MAMMSVAFTGTGLFVSELVHKRQLVVEHLQQLTEQIRHREDAEQQPSETCRRPVEVRPR
jgi:hypothetical protein